MPRLTYSKRTALRQAVEMQRIAFEAVQLLDGDMRETTDKETRARAATAMSGLGRHWTALQESIVVVMSQTLSLVIR